MAVALLLSGAAAMKGSLHGDAPMLEHVKEVEGHGKGHDRTHVLTELAACATEMSGEMRDISHASAVIATFSSMLVYKLTNLQKNSIPLHASFVINAHILQTALYRVNFNLATVLVSPYFRGLADATQLMATWSQKATWDARRKKGEVGMVAPGNSARGTVAKLMALRNFPHADANGDGMLNAAEMERAGLTPVEMERVDDEMLSPRRYAEIIAARSPLPPAAAAFASATASAAAAETGAPVDARRAPSAWGGAATALLQLSEANANATAASATPAPAATAAAAAAAAVAARFAAIRLGQEQAGTKESAAAAAAAAYPPSMYAGALKVIDELIYYTTYADEAIAELGSFAIGITEHAECVEHKLEELLGMPAASDEEVPAPVVASIGTIMLASDAMSQMVQRLFLVPTSGFTQSQTMLRQINTYLSTQWLAISSMGALRNGPHGSIDKWAATELLPKTYWG